MRSKGGCLLPPGQQLITFGNGVGIDPTAKFRAGSPKHPITNGEQTMVLRSAEWIGPIAIAHRCYTNCDSYERTDVVAGDGTLVGSSVRFVTDMHRPGPHAKRGEGSYLSCGRRRGKWSIDWSQCDNFRRSPHRRGFCYRAGSRGCRRRVAGYCRRWLSGAPDPTIA